MKYPSAEVNPANQLGSLIGWRSRTTAGLSTRKILGNATARPLKGLGSFKP